MRDLPERTFGRSLFAGVLKPAALALVALSDEFADSGLKLGQHFRRNARPCALGQKVVKGLLGAHVGEGRGPVLVIPDQMIAVEDDAASARSGAIPLPFLDFDKAHG